MKTSIAIISFLLFCSHFAFSQACEPGEFNHPENGCTDCLEGTYQNNSNADFCNDCELGKYQDERGQTECKICPMGTKGDVTGLTACKPCEEGEYQDEEGNSTCKQCPEGYISPKGSTSLSDCVLTNPKGSVEITGRLSVESLLRTNSSDELVIRRADGLLGYREASTLSDDDGNSSNELQTISIISDSLNLSLEGGKIALSDLIIKYFLTLQNGISTLINAGESLENLIAAGAAIQDLIDAGTTVPNLLAAGVTVQGLVDAGVSNQDLIDAGVTIEDLIATGVNIQDLVDDLGGVVETIKAGMNPQYIIDTLGQTVEDLLILDFCDIAAPLQLAQSGLSLDSLYGKSFQEGVIFYVDTTNLISGVDALVAAVTNQSSVASWGCIGEVVNNANLTAIGTGQSNTSNIISNGCPSSGNTLAASACDVYDSGDYDDWFLPSKDELNEMKNNLHLKGHNNFLIEGGGDYWSSSQIDNNNAWSQFFIGLNIDTPGQERSQGKQIGWRVRAIRMVLTPSCI